MDWLLTARWHLVRGNGKKYLCGFARVDELFVLYVSDWESVWQHVPSVETVRAQALEANIADFDGEKLRYLVSQIVAIFEADSLSGCEPEIRETSAALNFQVSLLDSLQWTFLLAPCDEQTRSQFFKALCEVNISNQKYLLFQTRKLYKIIKIQQKYALYLEENYKTVNGSELMDKYRRQHPEDALHLQTFSKESFSEQCLTDYEQDDVSDQESPMDFFAKLMRQTAAGRLGVPDLSPIKKEPTMIEGIRDPMQIGAIAHKRPKLEDFGDIPRPKRIKREDSSPGTPANLPSSPTKQTSSSPARLDGSSPRRRRIGRIGRR